MFLPYTKQISRHMLAMRFARQGICTMTGSSQTSKAGSSIGCLLLSIILTPSTAISAGFSTNFQPTSTGWGGSDPTGACVFASPDCSSTNWGNGDPTPFEYSLVTVDGQKYFHTIVGDAASGFAIESYTPYGAGPKAIAGTVNEGDFSPSSGGNETSVIGDAPSVLSLGYIQGRTNAANPFTNVHASGDGSADPSKVVVRMVLTSADGTMSLEYYKPFLDRKPRITQTIEDGGLTGVFVADMRDIGYQDKNTPIKITNNLSIVDPNIPDGSGNFEMALAQTPDVSAGRYTFSAGSGWNSADGWESPSSSFGLGTYTYLSTETGFDPYTYDWASVFDHAQNALNCARPAGNGVVRDNLDTSAYGGGASCPN